MIKRFLYFTLLFLCCIFKVSAQLPPVFVFSEDRDRFAVQLDSILQKTLDKKSLGEFEKSFMSVWRSGQIPTEYHQKIIQTMNKMSERRVRVSPDCLNYLETILAFNKANHWGDSFTNWNSAITDLVGDIAIPQSKINLLLVNTTNLFKKHIVFSDHIRD